MKEKKKQLRLRRLKSLERGNKRTEKNTNQAIESGFQSTSQEHTLKLIRPMNNISLLKRSCTFFTVTTITSSKNRYSDQFSHGLWQSFILWSKKIRFRSWKPEEQNGFCLIKHRRATKQGFGSGFGESSSCWRHFLWEAMAAKVW